MIYVLALIAAILLFGAAAIRSAIGFVIAFLFGFGVLVYLFRDNLALFMAIAAVLLLVAYTAMRMVGYDADGNKKDD